MSKNIVLLGDRTTSNGSVITATSTISIQGKKVALVGDLISCPITGHSVNPIVQGSDECFVDGKAVAVDLSLCACGCRVLASTDTMGV